MKVNYLIVDAGFTGATLAGKRVLVVDRRDHIGATPTTSMTPTGSWCTATAHIFHTNSKEVGR